MKRVPDEPTTIASYLGMSRNIENAVSEELKVNSVTTLRVDKLIKTPVKVEDE